MEGEPPVCTGFSGTSPSGTAVTHQASYHFNVAGDVGPQLIHLIGLETNSHHSTCRRINNSVCSWYISTSGDCLIVRALYRQMSYTIGFFFKEFKCNKIICSFSALWVLQQGNNSVLPTQDMYLKPGKNECKQDANFIQKVDNVSICNLEGSLGALL